MPKNVKDLHAMFMEACEVARDANLRDAELADYVRSFLCDCAPDMRVNIKDAVQGFHYAKGPRAEHIAGDVAHMLIAGERPSKRHLLCACNRAWVRGERGVTIGAEGWAHGYDDCVPVEK